MSAEYKVNILRVVDGDTVDVDIDLGFGMWLRKERVRVMGIDTPEFEISIMFFFRESVVWVDSLWCADYLTLLFKLFQA